MCLSPIFDTHSFDFHPKAVPCGHCLECVSRYQNDWMIRLTEESKEWKTKVFFTLKYHNDRVPYVDVDLRSLSYQDYEKLRLSLMNLLPNKSMQLKYNKPSYEYLRANYLEQYDFKGFVEVPAPCVYDIQTFFKNLRYDFEKLGVDKNAFKYFVTSEYGPTTLRPHYHGVLFCNIPVLQVLPLIRKRWIEIGTRPDISSKLQGYCVEVSEVRSDGGVANYISKYINKPSEFENPYVTLGLIPKCFRLMSKGIGLNYRYKLVKKSIACYEEFGFNISYKPFTGCKVPSMIILNPEHIDEVKSLFWDRLVHVLQYPVVTKNGLFVYNVPRYFREFCFPQCRQIRLVHKNNKKHDYTIIERKTTRKDCTSPVSLSYQDYVQDKFDKRTEARFAEIKASHPNETDEELCRLLSLALQQDLFQRFKKKYTNLRNFYSRKLHKND